MDMEDVNGWWNRVSENILRAGTGILGESSGRIWENKETWWFNDEVQQKVQAKNLLTSTEHGKISGKAERTTYGFY